MITHKKTFALTAVIHFLLTLAAGIGVVLLSLSSGDGVAQPSSFVEEFDTLYSIFVLLASPLLLIFDIFIFELFGLPYRLPITLLILLANSFLVSYMLVFIFERIRRQSPMPPLIKP